jgi:hypothetical protein
MQRRKKPLEKIQRSIQVKRLGREKQLNQGCNIHPRCKTVRSRIRKAAA